MRMKTTLAALSIFMGVSSTALAQITLAYWNFNSFDPETAETITADIGTGTVSLSGWEGGVDNLTGSTIGALNGDEAGASLSLQGGVDLVGNGTFIMISFSMLNLTDLSVDFATRGTSQGFTEGTWSWSTDNISYTDFGTNTATRDTTFAAATTQNTSALDGVATAYLRYTLDGAIGTFGNNRIDNLTLSAVPEPSAAILTGLGALGLVLVRRRERR